MMKKFITISIVLIILWSLFVNLAYSDTYVREVVPTIDDYLLTYSKAFGSSYEELKTVMKCESSGQQNTVSDGGKAVGLFQFWPETWERYTRLYNEHYVTNDSFDRNSPHDQIKLAAFAFTLGTKAKNEWTTYRAIQNNGTYIFTGRNGITYHVHCKLNNS